MSFVSSFSYGGLGGKQANPSSSVKSYNGIVLPCSSNPITQAHLIDDFETGTDLMERLIPLYSDSASWSNVSNTFTCVTSGYYNVYYNFLLKKTGDDVLVDCFIYKNGVLEMNIKQMYSGSNVSGTMNGSKVVQMNAGDVLLVKIKSEGGSVIISRDENKSWFSVIFFYIFI
jgi:hypothetical protein